MRAREPFAQKVGGGPRVDRRGHTEEQVGARAAPPECRVVLVVKI